MTNTRTAVSTTAVLILALAGGCNRTPAEEQEGTEEARQEASQEINEAKREGAEAVGEAKREATEEVGEAKREGAEMVGEAEREGAESKDQAGLDREPVRGTEAEQADQEATNEAVREANRDVAEDRLALREWSQEKLVGLDKDIGQLSIDAQEAAVNVQQRVQGGLEQLRSERDALVKDITAIDTKAGKQLDGYKKQLQATFDKLDERVDKLRDEL